MKENFIVYMHTSPSGKVYIGLTSQKLSLRWRNGKGYINNKYFYRAIEKYTWDAFKHEILFEGLNKEDAKAKEIEYINKYNSTNPLYGYNRTRGGDTRISLSEESRAMLSRKLRGIKRSEETRKKISEWQKVHHVKQLTPEWKAKISQSLIGNQRAKGHCNIKYKIEQSDLNDISIQIYNSGAEASKKNNIDYSGIMRAARENATISDLRCSKYGGIFKGYKWFIIGDDNTRMIAPNQIPKKKRKITH